MKYPVSAIFRSLQGEGHFVGYPAVFIRLAGCSVLGCSIRAECDESPWKATETLTEVEIAARAAFMLPRGIAVITGGEPTDHDLVPLVVMLRALGMRVHLETSGQRSVEGFPLDWLTVSPKTREYVQRSGHTLKVVVRPGWTWAEIRDLAAGTTFFHRYAGRVGPVRHSLQTMASKNLWPTPTVDGNYNRKGASKASGDGLATAVKTWPTPMAADSARGSSKFSRGNLTLTGAVRAWPTPNATDYKGPSTRSPGKERPTCDDDLPTRLGGPLNPTWVEWLMGWPLGWTACEQLEMDKFQQWLRLHGGCL